MNSLETQDLFTTNLHWELLSTNALINMTVFECCPDERYPLAHFTFNIRRRSPLYRATVTVPAISNCQMIDKINRIMFLLIISLISDFHAYAGRFHPATKFN